MEAIVQALALKEQLDTLRPIDFEQEKRIMQKFRLDWNYHSNHLEGNSLNYGETKALLLFGITAQGKPLKDHFEITGHNEAIDWVIDMVKGNRSLTENFIRELHQLLLKEPYEVDAITPEGKPTKRKIAVGQYKTMPNHVKTVTGEMFYFATPEETPAKMHDLLVWYNEKNAQQNFNPILIAAEFHYKFIRIHPFDDGNGRTARILMNFILMQFHYPPVIVKTEDKANYFAALQLADAGNIEAFVEYIAQNLVRSLEIMIVGANGENIEEDDDIDKEIALLEQRLSHLGNKKIPHPINKISNQEYIKHLMLFTLENFCTNNFKFFKLYEESLFFIEVGNEINYLSENNVLGFFNSHFNFFYNHQSLTFQFTFKNLKKLSLVESYYSNRVELKFFTNYVQVIINNSEIKEIIFEIDLVEKQIKNLVKLELKRHKNFIEQKIAEKEKK
jgi:Fic family protein